MTARGIVDSQQVPNPDASVKVVNISIPITSKMTPQADVIAFYQKDGMIISDQIRINLGLNQDNFVSS
jgi:outer membrane receptor for monomeric catechols